MHLVVFLALPLLLSTHPHLQAEIQAQSQLAKSVEEFNLRTKEQREKLGEPPLTEAEVIAAIRSIPYLSPGLVRSQATFDQIAERRALYYRSALYVREEILVGEYACKCWQIKLKVGLGAFSAAILPIRTKLISSQKLTAEELADRKANGPSQRSPALPPIR